MRHTASKISAAEHGLDAAEIADKAILCLVARELGKFGYQLADQLQDELTLEIPLGEVIDLNERNKDKAVLDLRDVRAHIEAWVRDLQLKKFVIVDKFQKASAVSGGMKVRRYELKELKGPHAA